MKDINDIWGFIEENYERYYNSHEVLEHDILTRFIEGEDVCEDDIKWIKDELNSADKINHRLIEITLKLISISVISYYGKLFEQIGEQVEKRLKE